jgi:uncharacterized protein
MTMSADDDFELGITENERVLIEAAAFRRLLAHLRERTDVQNLDLMNLAGFCRNCLSNWLQDAAAAHHLLLGRDAARTHVYGMPYEEWKALYQRDSGAAPAAVRPIGAADHTKHRG